MEPLGLLSYSFRSDQIEDDDDYHQKIVEYLSKLDKLPSKDLTTTVGSDNDSLNPETQTLPYLYVLIACIAPHERSTSQALPKELTPDGVTFLKIRLFLEKFDPVQIRYVGKEWRRLVKFLLRVSELFNVPHLALSPLRAAILRLDGGGGVLTSNHLTFVRICLSCREFSAAERILENPITSLPSKESTEIDPQYPCSIHAVSSGFITEESGFTDLLRVADIQEYFLLGGMIYIALHKWSEAQLMFEHVLVTPSQGAASGLMLEAYQKWLIVSCLGLGRTVKVPKLAQGRAMHDIASCSRHYEAVAEAFTAGNAAKLAAEIDFASQSFDQDGNLGLVNLLPQYLSRFYISGLANIYSALPISTIAAALNTSPADTLHYLQSLISDGTLRATILPPPSTSADQSPILRFSTANVAAPTIKAEEEALQELKRQTLRTNLLAEYVRDADRRLAVTEEYLHTVIRKEKDRKEQEKALAASGGGIAGKDGSIMLDSLHGNGLIWVGDDDDVDMMGAGYEEGLDEDLMDEA